MPTTNKRYYKEELGRAADLISRRYVLWMSIYESGKYMMCRVSPKQIVATADRGLSPVVYGARLGLDLSAMGENKFNDRLDDNNGIVWLGDIGKDGSVLCGALLAATMVSIRSKLWKELTGGQ